MKTALSDHLIMLFMKAITDAVDFLSWYIKPIVNKLKNTHLLLRSWGAFHLKPFCICATFVCLFESQQIVFDVEDTNECILPDQLFIKEPFEMALRLCVFWYVNLHYYGIWMMWWCLSFYPKNVIFKDWSWIWLKRYGSWRLL